MYTVAGLNKAYPTPNGSLNVLKDIHFTLNPGSLTAIIGESGSGKSTLLQILGTLDQADSGEIFLNGLALHQLNEQMLARVRNQHIGFIYQSHHLVPELTAVENVMLPALIAGIKHQKASQDAHNLLDHLGLKERCQHIPAQLSGGEAQRVSVARALINKPSLILADEPTGNLDESTAYIVFNMMRDLCKQQNIAVVMVTHSLAFADKCDQVYTLTQQQLKPLPFKNP